MRPLMAGFTAALVMFTTAPAVARAAPPSAPERAMAWVVDASRRAPISDAELGEHATAEFNRSIGGAAGLNQVFAQLGPFTETGPVLRAEPAQRQTILSGKAGRYLTDVDVDASGLLTGLLFKPYEQAPASWAELDGRLRALAPQVSFAAARVDRNGKCRSVHEVNADTARPLGSAFKLYVLGALSEAIAKGRLSWDQKFPIRDDWKSLPSGVLQDRPAGTMLTLREYANYMISISDNTATDHLIHIVGRGDVHTNQSGPVLLTRDLFVLKGVLYPHLADAYKVLGSLMLPALQYVPLSRVQTWTTPRRIDSIEWFGSPIDMCRQLSRLDRMPGTNESLEINDGGIGLDRAKYPTVRFKGGSEPGVLTLNYLAKTVDGGTVTTSVMLSNPDTPLDEATVIPQALALARAGIQLA